jgi:hypothetical protein
MHAVQDPLCVVRLIDAPPPAPAPRRLGGSARVTEGLDAIQRWRGAPGGGHPAAKSQLGEALRYARNQWQNLCRYTEDGRLPIDNGRSERALRQVALGRKKWLFAGSDEGARLAAALYTLIESCKRNRLAPFGYLRDLLERPPPARPASSPS